MKASEVITELKKLINKHGDREFNVYLSYSKAMRGVSELVFDLEEKIIYAGVYG